MPNLIKSVYEAPNAADFIPVQQYEEILVHPHCDFKKGVTLAAGFQHVNAGDVLGMITTGPQTGKFRVRAAASVDGSQVPVCIAARPVQMVNYDPSLPNDNALLDVDFAIDAIFKGLVKASTVHGITSADYAAFGIVDLRPYQDVMILN